MIRELPVGVYKVDGGYKAQVWDHGPVFICDYDKEKGDWVDCVWASPEEASKAREEWFAFWKEARS